ncbi:dienelactone hydrolase family protein [Arthrobacter sp. AD-310]
MILPHPRRCPPARGRFRRRLRSPCRAGLCGWPADSYARPGGCPGEVRRGAPAHRVPGGDHAFHNDTGDRYNEAQATAAWNDTLAWFAEHV